MAEMVLPPLFQVIFDRLASPLLEELGDMWDFKDNLKNLQQMLPMVQAVLEDAEQRQFTEKAVRIWLLRLRDVVGDAEDFLDECVAKGTLKKMFGILISFSFFKSDWTDDVHKLKMTLQELAMLAQEGLNLQLREGGVVVDRPSSIRESSSWVIESEVVGRDEDRENIVKLLLSSETSHSQGGDGDVMLIPIIGIGGLGKTTLAQLVYNDERVKKHFDMKLWVFVSHEFDVKAIIRKVIESAAMAIRSAAMATGSETAAMAIRSAAMTTESATMVTYDFQGMDVLLSELWRLLHKKKYLLVLDDVWNEDQDEWDKLRPLFIGSGVGSKIILTTRSKKVALTIDAPTSPYYLKDLLDEDCFALFKQRAFHRGEEKEHPNLIPIGMEIVKKCGGVPLAAKTLGGLMRFKREEREWLYVQNSELWKLDVGQSGILPALRLSYFHLPSHLKQCFSYCSVFPQNYEIKKEKLIHLWMAQGYIQRRGPREPEEIGNEYFNDLLWMSFFQEVDNCDSGGMTAYKMHPLIHDLAKSVVGDRFTVLEHGLQSGSLASTRHSSVICNLRTSTIPEALYDAKRLRTLLLFSGIFFGKAPQKLFSSFKYLRVLDLNGSGLTSLDESICDFLCLRYLDLSNTPIRYLPRGISNLHSLETLNVSGCYNLEYFLDWSKMVNLRHLINSGCDALTSMYPARTIKCFQKLAWKCTSKSPHLLRTLPEFPVNSMRDLHLLRKLDLRGELKIKNLEKVKSIDDTQKARLYIDETQKAELEVKLNLESLALCWGNNNYGQKLNPAAGRNVAVLQERKHHHTAGSDVVALQEREHHHSAGPSQSHDSDPVEGQEVIEVLREVIEVLRPSHNLKQLFLGGYPGFNFPNWTLPNLTVLELTNCKNCQHLPTLGNLEQLEILYLCEMDEVKGIGTEFYGEDTTSRFPSLKELVLKGFPKLEEWSIVNDGDAFPKLMKLVVDKCPKLRTMPSFLSLQHLELRDCDAMILNSIENLNNLIALAIEKVPKMFSLSGRLLANNCCLNSIDIISCPKLRSLPSELGGLSALKSLTIRWCEELSSLPQDLQNLKALELLEISDCNSLISMPNDGIGGLSSLRTLSIENCSNLTFLSTSFQRLTSLEHLTIMYCPSLWSLPDGVHHLSALRSLTILSCPGFTSLPAGLQSVRTLHSLEIRSCPGLTMLPEWVENLVSLRSLLVSDCKNLMYLPGGLKLLTALQHLSIQDCPELEERCKEGSGEDWPKIAHIPYIHIGSARVTTSGAASSSSV